MGAHAKNGYQLAIKAAILEYVDEMATLKKRFRSFLHKYRELILLNKYYKFQAIYLAVSEILNLQFLTYDGDHLRKDCHLNFFPYFAHLHMSIQLLIKYEGATSYCY